MPDQPIGPGDLVLITVADCPELSRAFRVNVDGNLDLPLLPHPLPARQLAPAALAKNLGAELVTAGILVSPSVDVSVVEYRSRLVTVIGAVHHPLSFQAANDTTLVDAIAKAEGLMPEAGSDVIVSRRIPGDNSAAKSIRIPVRALMRGNDQSLNLKLQGGEDVLIPRTGRFYITGNVKKPGAYDLAEGSDTTLLKALALSEGVAPFPGKEAYIYRKAEGASVREEIPVPLGQIIARKSPDITLHPDDVLYVPENKRKHLTATTLDRITGFAASTGSGLLIFH